jgi:hypothetical protein
MGPSDWGILVLTLCLVACGTTAGSEKGEAVRARSNVITAEELAARDHSTALEAVQSLRPNWLRERGPVSIRHARAAEAIVYLDGTRVGGVDFLRQIRANTVASIEFLGGTEATLRFGTGHVGGAILVSTPGS